MTEHIYKFGIAVIRDNLLLLCKPFAFDDLIVPGGIKEADETAIDNLRREIREELGEDAKLDEATLRHVGTFSDRAAGRSDRVVTIELYTGEIAGPLVANSEIKELVWFDPFAATNHKLSAIVKYKIIPYLLKRKLLHRPTSG